MMLLPLSPVSAALRTKTVACVSLTYVKKAKPYCYVEGLLCFALLHSLWVTNIYVPIVPNFWIHRCRLVATIVTLLLLCGAPQLNRLLYLASCSPAYFSYYFLTATVLRWMPFGYIPKDSVVGTL